VSGAPDERAGHCEQCGDEDSTPHHGVIQHWRRR
jgi:hypothetical protein